MMKTLDTTERYFTHAEADRIAAEMQKADPDWRYVVKKGERWAIIEVYDEEGKLVSKV